MMIEMFGLKPVYIYPLPPRTEVRGYLEIRLNKYFLFVDLTALAIAGAVTKGRGFQRFSKNYKLEFRGRKIWFLTTFQTMCPMCLCG